LEIKIVLATFDSFYIISSEQFHKISLAEYCIFISLSFHSAPLYVASLHRNIVVALSLFILSFYSIIVF